MLAVMMMLSLRNAANRLVSFWTIAWSRSEISFRTVGSSSPWAKLAQGSRNNMQAIKTLIRPMNTLRLRRAQSSGGVFHISGFDGGGLYVTMCGGPPMAFDCLGRSRLDRGAAGPGDGSGCHPPI